jgi:replicative DNA helicase
VINPSEAELAVIGSCLCESDCLRVAMGVLSSENFADKNAAEVFKRMSEESAAGRPVDIVTVTDRWRSESGIVKWLYDCVEKVPSALNVAHYADIVYRAWAERRLADAAFLVGKEPDNEAYRESVRVALVDIVKMQGRNTDMGKAATEYLDELDNRSLGLGKHYRTGIPTLDKMLTAGGFRPGQLAVVGARPGKGKSSLLIQSAMRFAEDGAKVLFFSAEMTVPEIMDRMTAIKSGIPLHVLGTKRWEESKARVCAVVQQVQRLPIIFNVGGGFSLSRVIADIESHSPDIVIIDFIQRFAMPSGKDNNRAAFFSDVANGLKSVAMTKKLVVLTASQLGRSVEFREEKQPCLADMKESGGIEEAADIAILFYFPEEPDAMNRRNGHFIVAKQRNGPTGQIPVTFFGNTTEFKEIVEDRFEN